ncbi:unnamed protein product [Nesidiocoris tenuis]|uniref:Uncharacterized protein n=1 Tax=Nesidiocoris tenuis TaxID=355587 RepID=A0A6H5G3H4_9HEMI|nr:unnamed protein product [Nesidiocoris tenuis]
MASKEIQRVGIRQENNRAYGGGHAEKPRDHHSPSHSCWALSAEFDKESNTNPNWTPLQVYENLCESFSNWWNEILYKYDPADNPSILKEPGLKLFFILCAMTTVSTFKEYFRTENASFWEAAALEKERKGLSAELFWRSLHRSIAPLNVIRSCVRLWSRMVLSIVKLPLMVSKLALDTPVYLYWLYMAHYVVQESLYLFRSEVDSSTTLPRIRVPDGLSALHNRVSHSVRKGLPLLTFKEIHGLCDAGKSIFD